MVFNPEDMCKHIRIINKRKIIQTCYNIHGQTLKETSNAKCLGATIDNILTRNSHIDAVMKKTNQTTAFLRINLSSCQKDAKANRYVHSSSSTEICFNIAQVGSVQSRAARFCNDDCCRNSSVTSMQQELGWEDLQSR